MVELFLDSANLDDIRACVDRGIISGVTVNQSLLAKEPKRPFEDHIKDIIAIISPKKLHLSVCVPSAGPEAMIEAGRHLRGELRYTNLSLKVPVCLDNLPVIAELSKTSGTFGSTANTVNATCVFSVQQAIVAAHAGAKVVSVFVGRINDAHINDAHGEDRGYDVLRMTAGLELGVKIIAGSIRDADMVLMAAGSGANIITTSRKVLESLSEDEHARESVAKFDADWASWNS